MIQHIPFSKLSKNEIYLDNDTTGTGGSEKLKFIKREKLSLCFESLAVDSIYEKDSDGLVKFTINSLFYKEVG